MNYTSYIDADTLNSYETVTLKDGVICVLIPLEDYWSMAMVEGESNAYKEICRKLIDKM